MRLTRSNPKDYESLRSLVHHATRGAQTVVMQAGHFLLYYDKERGNILPCLEEALTEPSHAQIRMDYSRFPKLTWQLGLRLLASLSAPKKYVMIVVNDWQYLPSTANRADFYSQNKSLPTSYSEELSRYVGRIALFEPRKVTAGVSTAPFFGEMNLRNRYQRHVSKLITAGKLPQKAVLESRNNGVFCSLPDLAGVQREVYCSGKTGDCTGEIAEMLHEASARANATCFVNLYPLVCREFVELGSQFAVELLGATCTTVLNLGFQSTAVDDSIQLIETTEATLHQFTPNSSSSQVT